MLARIDGESDRLRQIVEDLLWLASFDSAPPEPSDEPLDLTTIAASLRGPVPRRWRTSARASTFRSSPVARHPPGSALRRTGSTGWPACLIDNACRYAGAGGTVRISVGQRGTRVTLTVEDSGPGVAAEDRARLFDRFHRSTVQGGSAGLGLAIADSIVRSTDGQWRLGDSDLGGALFDVSWRRASARHSAAGGERSARPPDPLAPAGQPGPSQPGPSQPAPGEPDEAGGEPDEAGGEPVEAGDAAGTAGGGAPSGPAGARSAGGSSRSTVA